MPWRKGNRLPLVQENEVSAQVAEIFDEMKAALGIAYVPLYFRSLACYPKFLEAQWRTLRPLLSTREFFELTGRLRAEVYTYVYNYFKVPSLGEGATRTQATAVMDQLAYVDSVALLLLSVQLQAFEGHVGRAGEMHPADRVATAPAPAFVDAESATSPVKRVLDEMRSTLDLPFTGDEQRALAAWPELLLAYWKGLKPGSHSIFHEQAIYRLRESAWNCVQEIPMEIDMEISRLLDSGVDPDEMAELTRVTELLVRGAASGLLNSTFAKLGLEGGNENAQSLEDAERVA